MRALAQEELEGLARRREQIESELKVLLLPKDPNDEKNVILEIRGGHGRRGSRAVRQRSLSDVHAVCRTTGMEARGHVAQRGRPGRHQGGHRQHRGASGVYSKLKYESGVHRVQRVPATEASGRIHTSTAPSPCCPKPTKSTSRSNAKDLRIDTFCSSGPGGQSVNTTYSAVRVTHIPTGSWSRSRTRNHKSRIGRRRLKVLRSRLYEMEMRKQQEAIAKDRKSQVGTGRTVREDPHLQLSPEPHHRSPHPFHDAPAARRARRRPDELIDALTTFYTAQPLKEATEGAESPSAAQAR